jgi:hypothetical protein
MPKTANEWPTALSPEVYAELTRPFGADELEVRVGATTGPDNDKKGLVIPYTDANSIRNRLDRVIGPTNWSFTPTEWRSYAPQVLTKTDPQTGVVEEKVDGQRVVVWGALKVFGVERADCGEGYSEDESFKSAVTDAFKRAATAFGFGRELYNLPRQLWCKVKSAGRGWVFDNPADVKAQIAAMSAEPQATKPAQEPTTKSAQVGAKVGNGGITFEQLKSIQTLRKQYYGADEAGDAIYRDQLENNYKVRSSKLLTTAQANILVGFLNKKVQAGEVYNPGGVPVEDGDSGFVREAAV